MYYSHPHHLLQLLSSTFKRHFQPHRAHRPKHYQYHQLKNLREPCTHFHQSTLRPALALEVRIPQSSKQPEHHSPTTKNFCGNAPAFIPSPATPHVSVIYVQMHSRRLTKCSNHCMRRLVFLKARPRKCIPGSTQNLQGALW